MTTANKRRYWGFVPGNVPAAVLTAQAKMQEDAGLAGWLTITRPRPQYSPRLF